SRAPAAIRAWYTSGKCARSSTRPRGMNAWGCRKCGMPRRGQAGASRAAPASTGSRSTRRTTCPRRASVSAAARPATPPPAIITWYVTAPPPVVPLSIGGRRRRPVPDTLRRMTDRAAEVWTRDEAYDLFPRIEEEFNAALDVSLDPSGPDQLHDLV